MRFTVNPAVFFAILVVIGIGVAIAVVWQLYDAREGLWALYVQTVRRGAVPPGAAEGDVSRFLESERFRIAYEFTPLEEVSIEDIGTAELSLWLEWYLGRQVVSLRQMQAIVVSLSALLVVMLGVARVETYAHQRGIESAREVSRAIAETEERERRRIGDELHDGLGQMLSLALLQLRSDPVLAGNTLAGAVSGLRTIAHELAVRAEDPEETTRDLHELLSRHGTAGGIATSLSCSGLERVSSSARRHLYRIVQELLSNMVKHSRASRASIRIFPQVDRLIVRYDDDGRGLPVAAAERGHGLSTIHRRVSILDGTVRAIDGPGVALVISIPMTEDSV